MSKKRYCINCANMKFVYDGGSDYCKVEIGYKDEAMNRIPENIDYEVYNKKNDCKFYKPSKSTKLHNAICGFWGGKRI